MVLGVDKADSGSPSSPVVDSATIDAERTYSRTRTIFKKKISLAKELLKDDDSAVRTLQDARDDLRAVISALETCSIGCREDNCQDLGDFLTETAGIVAKVDKQIQSSKAALDRDSKVRLSEVRTPKFSGRVGDYPKFKASFQELVAKRASDQVALIKLREEAFAADSTEQLLIEGVQTLSEAFKTLDQQFAHPETLRNALIVRLREVPPIFRLSDALALRRLAALVRSTMSTLNKLGKLENLDSAVFSTIMTKLPARLRQDIDDQILDLSYTLDAETSIKQKFELLLRKCERQALVTETHTYRTRAYAPAGPQQGSGARQGAGFGSKPSGSLPGKSPLAEVLLVQSSQSTCIFHPEAKKHQTPYCNKLLVLPTHEILNTLQTNGHCLRCFRKHGSEANCKVVCSEPGCGQPQTHSKLLHAAFHMDVGPQSQTSMQGCRTTPRPEDTDTPDPQTNSEIFYDSVAKQPDDNADYDSDSSNTACTSVVEALHGSPAPASEIADFQTVVGKNSLRPCQKAYTMTTGRQLVPVNVLYDLGSDLSQVTISCVHQTDLKPLGSIPRLDLLVAGSAKPKAFGACEIYSLPIYDCHGALMYRVDCVAIPFIGRLRPTEISSVAHRFARGGYDCSDLQSSPAGEIQVLVGANAPGHHPIPIATIESVTLAQSRSGKILYGSHPLFPLSIDVTQSHAVASGHIQAWAVVSRTGGSQYPETHIETSAFAQGPKDGDLYDQLAEVDELPCKNCGFRKSTSKEEVRKLEIYRDCLTFLPEEHKVVAHLPWTVDLSNLPDNKPVAFKRLVSVTKSLNNKPDLHETYRAEFQAMIDKRIVCEVTTEEAQAWQESGGATWYVPHFPVVNPNSSSTPVRVVFDSSVPYKGIKLSKLWELPPKVVPDIIAMYIRFRDFPYALVLDFRKAYWTVHLHDKESHMQRLLWNNLDLAGEVKVYRMLRNSFGMVPSGALCSLAMVLVAEHFRDQYPSVYEFVSEQIYVDDGVSSCRSVQETIRLAQDIFTVMAKGGFEIKHFLFAGQSLTAAEASGLQTALPECGILAQKPHRVLGALWDPVRDTLTLEGKLGVQPSRAGRNARVPSPDARGLPSTVTYPPDLTMRQYLSAMASFFDPLGLATPVSILLKHELGRLFLLSLKWDEPIPHGAVQSETPTYEKCVHLLRLLGEATSVSFARCVQPPDCTKVPILVGFCDSSQSAYAACVYMCWASGQGRRSTLVMAKAKPFPKKGAVLTIPRGELQACLLLARLVQVVRQNSRHTPERVILLSDSTIALGQLASPPIKLKLWPAVRVGEIRELTNVNDWFHVATDLNVADVATRGCSPDQLGCNSIWQCGPTFMALPVDKWPITPPSEVALKAGKSKAVDTILEIRPAVQMALPLPAVSLATIRSAPGDLLKDPVMAKQIFLQVIALNFRPLDRYDSWLKLRRIVARAIAFVSRLFCRQISRQKLPSNFATRKEQRAWLDLHDQFSPSPDEMQLATAVLVYIAQQSLTPKQVVSLGKLNPEQDTYGIWRAKGRLYKLESAPAIIPADSKLALVLLSAYHAKHHFGADATLAAVRESFWIVRGQTLANQVVAACVVCRKTRKKPILVDMAPLNQFKFQPAAVFSTVYIDLCGPYYCTPDGRSTRANPVHAKKVWVLIVICALTHAVHLEIVENYGTSGLLSALDTFVNFRSRPIRIIADSGSQIRGAEGILNSLWAEVDFSALKNHFCETTEWVFAPPGAHNFVGMAERIVAAVKTSFEVTTCSRQPVLDTLQFSRLLYATANLINDRPLTVGRNRISKLDDVRLIRPNDLLFGRSSPDMNQLANIDFNDMAAKKDQFFALLKHRRVFLNEFWTKFYQLVFHTLMPKQKWLTSGRPLHVGDIVLIRDVNPVRGIWTLGRVDQIMESIDGKPRQALIRYREALGRRAAAKSVNQATKVVIKSVRDVCVVLENPDGTEA